MYYETKMYYVFGWPKSYYFVTIRVSLFMLLYVVVMRRKFKNFIPILIVFIPGRTILMLFIWAMFVIFIQNYGCDTIVIYVMKKNEKKNTTKNAKTLEKLLKHVCD